MVTMGKNTVMNAPEEMHGWLENWCKDREGIWLFEHHHLMELEGELAKYGKRLWQSHHMFLPKPGQEEVDTDFEVQWLGSWNVAIGRGFYPAWVEIATKEV